MKRFVPLINNIFLNDVVIQFSLILNYIPLIARFVMNSAIIFSLEFLTEKMRFIGEKILYLQRYE